MNTREFREARDRLIASRARYEEALLSFAYPKLKGSFNWAHDWFDEIAAGQQRSALVIVEQDGSRQSASFEEMRGRSNQIARWLQSQGVAKGSRVMLMVGNQVELWRLMLAVMKVGGIIIPATTALGSDDLKDRIARAKVSAVVCNVADTPKFASVPGEYVRIAAGGAEGWRDLREAGSCADDALTHPGTSVDDTLLLYFTSGTTKRPKLVGHTQVSYPVGHLSTMYWTGLQPGDVHLNVSSPGWAKHAWSSFFAPWLAEATVYVYNYSRFDPVSLLDRMRADAVSTFCAPPTVWRMLIQAELGEKPGALREVTSAGEPLNAEVIARINEAWGLTIRDGYGQTETTAIIGNTPGTSVKPGSMGRPLPGVAVALVDPASGKLVPGTGEGEVCLDLSQAPLNLMTGYQGDPEANDAAMADGYYHTGDIAQRDADGYLTFVGRTDDIFKASDYKISPFELESALIEHPAVAEAAVVPAPDPIRLAVPKAYIGLAQGWEPSKETAREILSFARHCLAPYQRVRRVEFYDLPKTISGKIRRVELRHREEQFTPGTNSAEWRDDQFTDLGD